MAITTEEARISWNQALKGHQYRNLFAFWSEDSGFMLLILAVLTKSVTPHWRELLTVVIRGISPDTKTLQSWKWKGRPPKPTPFGLYPPPGTLPNPLVANPQEVQRQSIVQSLAQTRYSRRQEPARIERNIILAMA